MPVDSQHPEFTKHMSRWQKNLDAFDGEDAVKSKGELYLSKPGGFEAGDYERYKQRAKWYGATSQTVKGTRGAVFQKSPDIKISARTEKDIEDITLTGVSLEGLAGVLFSHMELIGRYGILLDYSEDQLRPYWSGFPASCIINWKLDRINGKMQLSQIVLKEVSYRPKDKFESIEIIRYRDCFLNDDGNYQIDTYEYGGLTYSGNDLMVPVEPSLFPTRRQQPLKFIPFQIFGADDLTFDVSNGPLDALVDVNYAYYRHSADYEHGLFMTALPTPVITGQSVDEGKKLTIGSLTAWVLENPEAKAYLLEFQGQGLIPHEKAMDNDKREMATLGARLLEEMPDTSETLGQVQIRHSGETGTLKHMTGLASEGLTRLVRWHHWMNGETELVEDPRYEYTLNTDFNTSRISPQAIQALMRLVQAGQMSAQTLFWNLHQGEVMPEHRTFEDEQRLIEIHPPARLAFQQGELDDDEEETEPNEGAA